MGILKHVSAYSGLCLSPVYTVTCLLTAQNSCILALVNNGMAEMSVLFPVSGGFIRMAGKWVDDAWGFMAG